MLQRGAFLFWDEPEAHINPIVFEPLAKLIVSLAENLGVQVFVSSHSYLFVRWIDIFSENAARFFYFKRLEDTVKVEEGDRYLDVVPDELDEFLLSYERLTDASHGTTEG